MKLINLKNEELLIDKDTNEPLILIYDLKKENRSDLKIRVREDIKASIIEIFLGTDTICEYNREFIIENNAKLEYLKFQNLDKNCVADFNYEIYLEEKATLNMINLEFGLGSIKNSYETFLNYENSKFLVNGLVKIYEESDLKSLFRTVHNAPNCLSDIAFKHILNDKTKATFEVKSIVNEKALNSKVYQNSQTLLLSDDATIFTQPHLEINIDELEASHGATVGSLDEEQLLYLQARGISKELAIEILLKAFENKVYDKIGDINIKKFIEGYKKV